VTDASRRFTLERAVQATTATTILVFVLASGSILSWLGTARVLRWPTLLVLAALSVALALRRGGALPASAFATGVAAFVGLALLSVLWSPKPLLSGAHAAVFALVLATCGALAWATWGRPDGISLVVDGVLLGLGLVALGGLVLLAVDYDRAVMPATTEFAARYQGLGGGPNTATMVMALGGPLAAQRLLRGSRWERAAAGALLLLLLGSIVASGSRGALLAAFAGLAVLAALTVRPSRRKVFAVGGVAVALLVAVAVMRAPDPLPPGTPSAFVPPFAGHDAESPFEPTGDFVDANFVLRLEDDVGHPGLGVADTRRRTRTLLNSSGRAQAWTGTLELVAERPIAGYGFGLEDKVFVDRYISFNSAVPENSYLGLSLQLGAAGLVALVTVLALLLVTGAKAYGRLDDRARLLLAACAGAVVAGLVLGGFQSFLYAVGNNATLTFWLAAFMVAAAAATRERATAR
jgi:O-antigen ligase